MFLGEDLLSYLLLAFGGAMLVGNLLAIARPPGPAQGSGGPGPGARVRPPLARSLIMASLGLVATVWALATLLQG